MSMEPLPGATEFVVVVCVLVVVLDLIVPDFIWTIKHRNHV